jgi:branched-chain amino acid transport system ATP-binding protein
LATNSALALTDVDAYYGDSHVLHGVSFALGEGRLLGLLGRNGAGKSTSMSVAVGLLPARRGKVAVFGKDVSKFSPEKISAEGVAFVPQGRRIFKSLTVRENLIVAERRLPRGKVGAWSLNRVFETFPRLKERHSQYAGSLSGGEQQMLAIGRALMNNPRVLLMDEPSEGLAPQIVAEVERIIARLKGEGLSIVLVEQNIKMTLDIADDVVIMNSGQVAFAGTAAEVRVRSDLIETHLGVH